MHTPDPDIVDVRRLSKTYQSGLFRQGFRALSEVSLEVGRGEIFGLLGPNGAGKTTLVKVLLGIVRATGGSATMLGFPAGDRRGRRRVGYLPEQLRVARHHTARTALQFYGQLHDLTTAQIRRKSQQLIDLVGLKGRDVESVRRFSKGMLQRLGLAQAMLNDPELLFLDEPTDGLDPVGRSQVRLLLQQMRDQGRTIFLNSHLLQEVELICDRIAVLDGGRVKYTGTIRDLTPADQSQVTFVCRADPAAITAATAALLPEIQLQPHEHDWQFTVGVSEQSLIDGLVDALRAGGISIVTLRETRPTLEDAFLHLVGQGQETA